MTPTKTHFWAPFWPQKRLKKLDPPPVHPILAAIFAQDWPKMSQDSPRQAQKGRRRSQDEPRPGHDEPRQAQNNPPRRAKIGPCTFGGFHGALLVYFRHTCEGGES